MENNSCEDSIGVGLKPHPVKKATDNIGSHSSQWDSHISPDNSKWVKENLDGMDEKVKTMLKLINEDADADSSAKTAEIHYQKRPELVSLVEEFYRVYLSLAEGYNYLRGKLSKSVPSSLNEHYRMDLSPSSQTFGVLVGTGNIDRPHKYEDSIAGDNKDSDCIVCTTSSGTEPENLLKTRLELQHFKEENERLKTDPEKSKEHYKIMEQQIRQFQIDILNLREENETLQKQITSDGSGLRRQIAKLQARNSDLESQISTMLLQINESSEKSSLFQKEDTEITKVQEFEREIQDLQQRRLTLEEENELLKLAFQRCFQDYDVTKRQVTNMENDSSNWVSALEINFGKLNCNVAELQGGNDVVRRQNNRSIHMENSSGNNDLQTEFSVLQEDNCGPRVLASVMQQTDFGDQATNLVIENENTRNEPSGQLDSIGKQITYIQREMQAKTEVAEVLQKQFEDLKEALLSSQCENTKLTGEYKRCMKEYDLANSRSKSLQSELAHAQQENQKLRKELSTRLTELKNLEVMLASLGKEKERIAAELMLKVSILDSMEEHLNDFKEQNKILSSKLEAYCRQHKSKIRELQGTISGLQDRNKILADQLLKSSEGCRALKRKLIEVQQQKRGFQSETAKLRVSIQKKEHAAHVLELEKTALQNEISWCKERLHVLQEKCHCFNEDPQPHAKQLGTKPDRQKSLNDEVALLEKLLLHFEEEIASFRRESHRTVKECQFLKRQLEELQSELILLRAENNSLKFEISSEESLKKLNADDSSLQNEKGISSAFEQIRNSEEECTERRNKLQELSREKEKGTLIWQHNFEPENKHLKPGLQGTCKESVDAEKTSTTNRQLLQLKDNNIIQEAHVSSQYDSLRMLKDSADVFPCKTEDRQTEVTRINMPKGKLKEEVSAIHMQDDDGDLTNQASRKASVIPKLNDNVQRGMAQLCRLEDEIRYLQQEADNLTEANMNLKAECQSVRQECYSSQNSLKNVQEEPGMATERPDLLQKQLLSLHEENIWPENNPPEAGPVSKAPAQEIIMIESENLSLQKEMSVKLEEIGKLNAELQRNLDELRRENFALYGGAQADGRRTENVRCGNIRGRN